jgi:RNA polymerase sigma-70 factor, ECF subfamily
VADSPVNTDIAALVAQHHRDVYRYAYRLAGTPEDAEELTQQVFLTAQAKLAQLRQPESARSWLFTILKRSYIKSRGHWRPISAGSLDLKLENIPERVPAADDVDREQLQLALDRLPPKHRLVLVMFYFEEASYREIAERLDMPIGTVMSRLARAKARLRDMLFETSGGERREITRAEPAAMHPRPTSKRTTVTR